jgi:hypothetical protein
MMRSDDGSAGDADYGEIGLAYARYRQPDQRISAKVNEALGSAETVLNVGAGSGSYEPIGRGVTAVEPSESMRSQRSRRPWMPLRRTSHSPMTASTLP